MNQEELYQAAKELQKLARQIGTARHEEQVINLYMLANDQVVHAGGYWFYLDRYVPVAEALETIRTTAKDLETASMATGAALLEHQHILRQSYP